MELKKFLIGFFDSVRCRNNQSIKKNNKFKFYLIVKTKKKIIYIKCRYLRRKIQPTQLNHPVRLMLLKNYYIFYYNEPCAFLNPP